MKTKKQNCGVSFLTKQKKQPSKRPQTLCFIFSLFFIMSTDSFSQQQKKIDSLAKIIKTTEIDTIKADNHLEIADILMYSDPKKVKMHIDSAGSLYKKSPHERGIANFYSLKSNYFYTQSAYDSSMVYIGKAGDQFIKIGDSLKAAITKSNLAILTKLISADYEKLEALVNEIEPIAQQYKDTALIASMMAYRADIASNKGHRNIAIDFSKKAINLREAVKDSVRLPQEFFKMGSLHLELFDYEKAIESFDKGIAIEEALNNKSLKAQLLKIKGTSQIKLKQYEDAEKNIIEALNISKDINLKTITIQSLIQLGYLEVERGNLPKANTYFKKAKALMKPTNSYAVDYNYNLFKGQANLAANKNRDALKNFDISEALAEKNNSLVNLSFSKFYKSQALENLGRYEDALALYKESSNAKDTLTSQLRTTLSIEQKIIYETERKEKEIALQKKDIEILEQKQKASSLQKTLLILGLISLAVMFSLIYYALRQRIKGNKLIRENLNKDIDFKNKELTTHALHLAQKNEVLEGLKLKVQELKADNSGQGCQQIIQAINFNLQDDNNWDNFSRYFEQVHSGFNASVKRKFPGITTNELRLLALLKMNMSSKEIASILNISNEGVKKARYRLRKKLDLTTDDSLQDAVLQL